MTAAQKAEALAAFDAFAEIFGPALGTGMDFKSSTGEFCAIGVLGLFNAKLSPDMGLDWNATERLWGFKPDEVWLKNDSYGGMTTPKQRFSHMRQFVADYEID